MTIKELRTRDGGHGFINEAELAQVAAENRLYPVLCRFHIGRFVTPAQDAAQFIEIIEKAGHYVRDVTLNHSSAPRL
jgi:hypothetical protein